MCLILFAWQQHADYPLVVIANRDEYYARPTRDAHWWEDASIFAGRDLEAGGTWLGVNRRGHFAAVTNVREAGGMTPGKRSRGELTQAYLANDADPRAYLEQLAPVDQEFAGFNLLLGNASELWFYSNREGEARAIEPGVYGVSNGRFDEPWPKLRSGREELAATLASPLDQSQLLEILTDHRKAEDHELPSTGVSVDVERLLSSRFIRSPGYGTRACTVLCFDRKGGVDFLEQNHVDAETRGATVHEVFATLGG